MRVAVARDLAELESIVPAWDRLAAEALEPNPFYESWMLLPALRAFGSGEDIRVVLAWQGERLAGVFPFRREPRYKGLPASALRSWAHVHCLLCTPLVAADVAPACLAALFSWCDASFIELRYLPAGQPFHRALSAALAARGINATVNRAWSRPFLRKNRASVSSPLRRQLGNKERRLAGRGRLERCTLSLGQDISRWIDDLLRLEAGGWKGRKGSAMACAEASRRFATEILEGAFRRGRLLMGGIDLDGRPIARRACFVAGDGAYAFKACSDETMAEFSPGAMLELDNVRQLDVSPGVEWMDSLAEEESEGHRLWPERRAMETLAVPVGAWGGVSAAALRWGGEYLRLLRSRGGAYDPARPWWTSGTSRSSRA